MARYTVGALKAVNEALKDTIGFDMTEVMRANTFEARTTRNVHMDMDVSRNEPEGPPRTLRKNKRVSAPNAPLPRQRGAFWVYPAWRRGTRARQSFY